MVYGYWPSDVPAFAFWLMPDEDPAFEAWPHSDLLHAWQRGRCAMCQVPDHIFDNRLVMDHDHETGKIRGLLCRGCNGSEPHNDGPAFTAWRAGFNPATVLGIDEFYESPLWGQAKPQPRIADDDPVLDQIAAAIADVDYAPPPRTEKQP